MGAEDADTRAKYERVCRELNLDQLTMDTAWKDYKAISEDYVLEVSWWDSMHTMCMVDHG